MPSRLFASADDFEGWICKVAPARFNREAAYRGGNLTALYDAVQDALYQGSDGEACALPQWALEAVHDRALPALMGVSDGTAAKRGRPAGKWDARRWRQDMIDWHRFCQVWYRRTARRDDLPQHPDLKAQRASRRTYQAKQAARPSTFTVDVCTPYPWTPGAHEDEWSVYDAVAIVFKGSPYQGSAATMKRSYERVTAALAAGEGWRFYPSKWLRYDARQTLEGVADLIGR